MKPFNILRIPVSLIYLLSAEISKFPSLSTALPKYALIKLPSSLISIFCVSKLK